MEYILLTKTHKQTTKKETKMTHNNKQNYFRPATSSQNFI